MDRNLAINLVRVTETAALNASRFLGKGDKNLADQAAVDGMRKMFDTVNINGTVVIGEGEMDEAPMLYIGEQIGSHCVSAEDVDIAVDPLDGTNAVAKGIAGSISVLSVAPRGTLLHAPDMYMEKIAVGPKAYGAVSLNKSVKENLESLSKALDKKIEDLTVTILDRPRHEELVRQVRETGARIKMFSDGDVEAAIATCMESTVDIMMGIGGAPEGVIAACALKCLGGYFEARLKPANEEEVERCHEMGIDHTDHILKISDLVKSDDVFFAATAVSPSQILKGIEFHGDDRATTYSVVMRSKTGTVRFIEAHHRLDKKPEYATIFNKYL